MKIGKIFKVFKKGSKAAKKAKGKKAEGEFEWPSGVRIGVYGHANSGKTVYFTVLNEECKISKDLQISVTDNSTAGEFLANYRAIWGIGATTDVGTMVDLREDRRFPEPTKGDKLLRFNAIVNRKNRVPVVTYDYNGEAASISGQHDLTEKVTDFISGSDGILFFFDPKVLGAEVRCQAHVASFVNMLERLAPLNRRLPVPVALVITKSDVLPGFSGENQSILISAEDESFLSEDFEPFLEKVLSSNNVAANSAWAGSVRDVLVKLKEFLKVVVGWTLDFQIFFVSCTGQPPEKIGTEVGRSIYAPPPKMTPIGVKEPFRWLLNSMTRSKRISAVRTIAKYVVILSLIWSVVFSLPYLYHFSWLLPRALQLEERTIGKRPRYEITGTGRTNVTTAFRRYENSWTVRLLFERFLVPSQQIRMQYMSGQMDEAKKELSQAIKRAASIAADESVWPMVDPVDSSLALDEPHRSVETVLDKYRAFDSTSELFAVSDRAAVLWDLFKKAIVPPSDTAAWNVIVRKVESYNKIYGNELSAAEKDLCKELVAASTARQETEVKKVTVKEAGSEFENLLAKIQESTDPKYLLGTAVRKLNNLKSELTGKDATRAETYLSNADYFNKSQRYDFTLINCPDGYHVHIMVLKRGMSEGVWKRGDMLWKLTRSSITWKSGDQIHVALDDDGHKSVGKETWGEQALALRVFDDPFAVFDMNGDIEFPGYGTITFSFDPDPKTKLPGF